MTRMKSEAKFNTFKISNLDEKVMNPLLGNKPIKDARGVDIVYDGLGQWTKNQFGF